MREIELLDKQDKTKCIFYFSSITLDDMSKNSQYLQHKRSMELLVKSNFENPHTPVSAEPKNPLRINSFLSMVNIILYKFMLFLLKKH